MKLKFIFFPLLIAGSNGSITISRMEKISRCVEMKCASYASAPDPCAKCRNQPIIITATSAMQVYPYGSDQSCKCAPHSLQCDEGEFIDTSTCHPNGSFKDCSCISSDPCAKCRNQPITITATSAIQPVASEDQPCMCRENNRECKNGEIIDKSTCTPYGDFDNCICISTYG